MKLLFDNNLSHKLVARLSDIFPDSTHVMFENMDEMEDNKIWEFAKENGFMIISNCNDMSLLYGFPPKIIWLRIGNCKLSDMEYIIRSHSIAINDFFHHKELAILEID